MRLEAVGYRWCVDIERRCELGHHLFDSGTSRLIAVKHHRDVADTSSPQQLDLLY